MPGLNGTGPQGQGPMTGGARGNCNPANAQGSRSVTQNMGFGRGMAYGRNFRGGYGRGRSNDYGMGQGYGSNIGANAEELNMLRTEVELLNQRIAELESKN
ncbi:MAG: DUF5320 domain-containing protein [Desulfobacteraceae bacterium]|nr:DUF5320 domain-containing protein [Desulfobacteraceae bacterium]